MLAADKNIEHALRGLLQRPPALGIRPISFDLFTHPRHDAGCVHGAADILAPLAAQYSHALVVFDHDGSGRETMEPNVLADEVERDLAARGWADRAGVVVIAPELEVWVWSNSLHVADCLGWGSRADELRLWLAQQAHWPVDAAKPPKPKEAMEAALRQVRQPRSSAIYARIATRVSLRGHAEPAFVRLTSVLAHWFAP